MQYLFQEKVDDMKKLPMIELPVISWDTQRFWINSTPPWLKSSSSVVSSAKTDPIESCM